MPYQVDVTTVEPIPLAVVRFVAAANQLSQVIPKTCGDVWQFIRANQIPNPGRHVAIYFDCKISIECGAEVPGPFASDGRFVASATPGGRVATTVHMGPYDRLGDAHKAIRDWCKSTNLKLDGPNWEIYGHWNDDPAKLRTDVFYLLADDAV